MRISVEYSTVMCAAVIKHGFENGASWWVMRSLDITTDMLLIIKPVTSAQHRINPNARISFPYPHGDTHTGILDPLRYQAVFSERPIPAAFHPSWCVTFDAAFVRGVSTFYKVHHKWKRNRSSPRRVGNWRYIPTDDMPQFCEEAAKYLCDFFANAGAEIYAV